jgi:hypothetical protein
MAVLKKAAKKAAKKAVPKVEAPKQIVLSQEQYDTLSSVGTEINSLIYALQGVFVNENDNVREVAFQVGVIKANLDAQHTKLSDIVTAVDPNPYVWEYDSDDDDNDDEENN